MKKVLLIVTLLFKNYSLLRIFQIIETKKLLLKGESLEFGASVNYKKNFSYFVGGNSKFYYSNIDNKKNTGFIKIDLRKNFKVKSNLYENILIYNVVEHLDNHSNTFSEINRILKKMEICLALLLFYTRFMVHLKIILDLQKIFF